jgi:hypothetical protein
LKTAKIVLTHNPHPDSPYNFLGFDYLLWLDVVNDMALQGLISVILKFAKQCPTN